MHPLARQLTHLQPQLTSLLVMVPREKRALFVRLLVKNAAGAMVHRAAGKPALQLVAETVWLCLEEPEARPVRYSFPP